MTTIDAIYENGIFRPIGPVSLPENARVKVTVASPPKKDILTWVKEMQAIHAEYLKSHPPMPDSTPLIAEDRNRGV